jgi:hypothetical protein
MDRHAVQLANERLWAAHPELGRRQLTDDPADKSLRAEWSRYYADASTVAAPPPAVSPAPAPPPPAAAVVATCPAAPAPITTGDCKEIKNHVQEGDIVLRGERGDDESEFIAKVSKCKFSHAGIVARNDKGELVVVDAYPGRGPKGDENKKAVAANSVDSFFCGHGATQGMVARPKDCTTAQKAAKWAYDQTKDPDYEFDLFDPWNKDPKSLYCADFVYQSYQNAGVDLVPDKMDFLSPANRADTLSAARDFKWKAKFASDRKLQNELLKMTGGSSDYITPCQVGSNSHTDTIVNFDTSTPSGASGGKKAE